ncbi:MAG: nucleoid-structuring protein H-NS [Methanotrichaceae archaeon]|nr:nucleoid-structuring protein H-NS [Methanotrichaceae archaeon]
MTQPPIGIDDIHVHLPDLFISTTGEFARSRGVVPAKLTRGIGIERMAVPDAHEDAATLAAMAILGLMKRSRVHPEDVGKIYIGTESAVDEAKAIGTYVIGMLEKAYGEGSFQECSTVELKSACIGATIALENAIHWLSCEDGLALVVGSDIARYKLRSPGEYTQGAGAVALLVKREPRLLAIDPVFGGFTRDEDDFYRPIGMHTAVVNGRHSNFCYVSAMVEAFAAFRRRAKDRGLFELANGECLTDQLSHLIFHIPYPRMAEYAASAVFREDWRGLDRFSNIQNEIGDEPREADYPDKDSFLQANWEYSKRLAKTALFRKSFEEKVAETTLISRQTGNIYTGSLYLGLSSLREAGRLAPGRRIGMGSYGSGCSALFFSGTVQPGVLDLPIQGLIEGLENRREIDLLEYEALHEGSRTSLNTPKGEFALLGIDETGYRRYGYVP